jgi:uncharacterized protein YecE (DUF72 family)
VGEGTIRIGCSGWSYRNWRGDFYPRGLRQRDELAYLAARTGAVEVNGSFYSLQRPASYAAWRDATPEGHRICVKGGRFLTHLKRLRDPRQGLANFLASGILALEDRTGPVLWQLPADLVLDEALVGAFLALLPRSTRRRPGWRGSTTTRSPRSAPSPRWSRTGRSHTCSRPVTAPSGPRRRSTCCAGTPSDWS